MQNNEQRADSLNQEQPNSPELTGAEAQAAWEAANAAVLKETAPVSPEAGQEKIASIDQLRSQEADLALQAEKIQEPAKRSKFLKAVSMLLATSFLAAGLSGNAKAGEVHQTASAGNIAQTMNLGIDLDGPNPGKSGLDKGGLDDGGKTLKIGDVGTKIKAVDGKVTGPTFKPAGNIVGGPIAGK